MTESEVAIRMSTTDVALPGSSDGAESHDPRQIGILLPTIKVSSRYGNPPTQTPFSIAAGHD